MKKVNLKTIEIAEAYKLLAEPKYQKLNDEDKVKLWKISRKLAPIALKYEEEKLDANKKLMPDDPEFPQKLQKAAQYENIKLGKESGELPITDEEYREIAKIFSEFNSLLKKALSELEEKEESIEIEPLSEEALGKLMDSNNWTFKQIDAIAFIVE